MESDKQIFPTIEIFPLTKIKKLAQFVFRMPHVFSERSDHFESPLDLDLDSRTYDDQEARMKSYWASICPDEL